MESSIRGHIARQIFPLLSIEYKMYLINRVNFKLRI